MKIDSAKLRALFPSLYSRRDPHDKLYNARDWPTLRLPNLRLMGPNWSFSAKVAALGETLDLRTLAESEVPRRLSGEQELHAPTFLQLRIDGVSGDKETPYKKSYSRHNAVAIQLLHPKHTQEPWQPFGPEIDGGEINTDLTTALILSTFGQVPENDESEMTHLAASRLVAGEIWAKPNDGYLTEARKKLGLTEPTAGTIEAENIVFLSDGAAIYGGVTLPWDDEEEVLFGWFKLVSRRHGASEVPALSLWTERDLDAEWQPKLEALENLLEEAGNFKLAPRWLEVRAARGLTPEALRWPCKVANEILLHRAATDPVMIASNDLLVQLGADTEGRTGQIAMRPPAITILSEAADGDGLRIIVKSAPDLDEDSVKTPEPGTSDTATDAAYGFTLTEVQDDMGEKHIVPDEYLDIGRGGEDRQLDLAVPTLANSARLRDVMGFDEPSFENETFPPLWLFSPLVDGWLQWPFPNTTLAIVDKLDDARDKPVPSDSKTVKTEEPETITEPETSGIWSMRPGPTDFVREWSMSLADAERADFYLVLGRIEGTPAFLSGYVALTDLDLAFDGILPVTAYRQSAERLLPETQERALLADRLSAVTPGLLTGAEGQLWDKEIIRVHAQIPALQLRPPATTKTPGTGASFGETGDTPSLTLSFLWPEAPPEPWAWLRHASLPTFQTMPLATAGAADREPSSLRELSPLRIFRADPNRLTFSNAFNMAVPGVRLDTDQIEAGQHPLAGESYLIDLGQAVTTLPSLSLFPGVDPLPNPDDPEQAWSGVTVTVTPRYRHDIALMDELYTLAKLPPPAPEDDKENGDSPEDAAPPPILFTPLPYNAPGDAKMSAWTDVWAGHARSLALATPAKERLFENDRFHDIFFDTNWHGKMRYATTIKRQGRDPEGSTFETQGTAGNVAHIGAISAEIEDVDMPPLHPGLPAVTDLSGLSFTLEDGAIVQRGALHSLGSATGYDQAGFTIGPPEIDGDGRKRDVLRVEVEPKKTTPRDNQPDLTFTLSKPASLLTGGVAHAAPELHFRDVAFRKESDNLYVADLAHAWTDDSADPDAFGRDEASRGNLPDHSLTHGFTWSLTQAGQNGTIALGPFRFEPVALIWVELTGDHRLSRAELIGRVGLPGDRIGEFVAAPRRAKLTLSSSPLVEEEPATTEGLYWQLKINDLELPLKDDDDNETGPPYLQAGETVLSVRGDALTVAAEDTRLDFRLEGRLYDASEEPNAPRSGGHDLNVALEEVSIDADKLSFVAWVAEETERARVELPILGVNARAKLRAEYRLMVKLDSGGAKLFLNQVIDLMEGKAIEHRDALKLGSGSLPVEAKVQVASDTLAVNWQKFGALAVFEAEITDAKGAALATVTPNDPVRPDGLEVLDVVQGFTLALGGTLTLRYDSAIEDGLFRLSGVMGGQNIFTWPSVSLTTVDGVVTGTPGDGQIQHRATATFEDARLPLSSIDQGKFFMVAEVNHRLTHVSSTGQETTLAQWNSFQSLVLWAPSKLAEDLKKRAESTDTYSLDAFHKLDVKRPFLVSSADAAPSGLTRQQMRDFAAAIKAGADDIKGPFVDISAHHVVNWHGDENLRPLSVPGFIADPGFETPFDFDATDKTITRQQDLAITVGMRPFDPGIRQRVKTRLGKAAQMARKKTTSLAHALLPNGAERQHRALFQSASTVETGGEVLAEDRLWAETAIWLSYMASSADRVTDPLIANALSGEGWVSDKMIDPELAEERRPNGTRPPRYTGNAHALSWSDKFLGHAGDLIYPAPPMPTPCAAGHRVTLYAPKRNGQKLSAVATIALDNAAFQTWLPRTPIPEGIKLWASATLARVAPWARKGLIQTATVAPDLRDPTSRLCDRWHDAAAVFSDAPDQSRQARLSRLSNDAGEPQPQRGRSPVAMEIAGKATAPPGFHMEGSAVATLISEPGDLPEDGQTTVRLTASSIGFAASVPGGGRTVHEDAYWLTARVTQPFRPFEEVPKEEEVPVTQALPPGLRAPVPAAFLTGRTGDTVTPHLPDRANSVIPPVVVDGLVAPRSGTPLVHRLGIEAALPQGVDAKWASPDIPQWVRSPRPVELGVNDRPTASAFSDMTMQLGRHPDAMLFGPAASLSKFDLTASGLDRSPRARFAHQLILKAPENGLIPNDWNGVLTVTMSDALGEPPEDEIWTVQKATLNLGDRAFEANEAKDSAFAPDQPLSLTGFETKTEEGTPESALAAVQTLRAGTPCRLTLQLERLGLTRLVGFRLWRAGGRLIEAPAFVRFEDPAYNDMLTGLPKLGRNRLPDTSDDLLLLAETPEVRPGSYFEAGLAIASADANASPSSKFLDDGGAAEIAFANETRPIKISFEIQRSADTEVQVIQLEGDPTQATYRNAEFASLPVSLSGLREQGQEESFRFLPKDRLKVIVTLAGPQGENRDLKFNLVLDVVDHPLLPPNPAVYHMLSLGLADDPENDAAHAPFQVTSPNPFVIELVDPEEMRFGIVRRRAVFQWATFIPPEPGKIWRFGLQKEAASGSAWLGDDFERHWRSLESDP